MFEGIVLPASCISFSFRLSEKGIDRIPSLSTTASGGKMATLQTTIPDDLSQQVQATARARGIPVHLLVEEALRCIVSPEPFASEEEAFEEMEALESEVLKDLPWRA